MAVAYTSLDFKPVKQNGTRRFSEEGKGLRQNKPNKSCSNEKRTQSVSAVPQKGVHPTDNVRLIWKKVRATKGMLGDITGQGSGRAWNSP